QAALAWAADGTQAATGEGGRARPPLPPGDAARAGRPREASRRRGRGTRRRGAGRTPAGRPRCLRCRRRTRTPSEGGKHVKVSIEKDELVIRLPLNKPPVPSGSGKTLVIASTRGNQRTEAVLDGQPVIIGVNAYIARPAR